MADKNSTYLFPSLFQAQPVLAHNERKHHQRNKLTCVCFGWGNSNFRTGINVNSAMGFATDRAPNGVGYSNNKRSSLLAVTKSHQSIRGFTLNESSQTFGLFGHVWAKLPDCEMKKQTSSLNTGVVRSKKSLANSTMTGSSVNSSKSCRVAIALW